MFNGADLSKREEVHNLVADTVSRLGSVDILVNNAGIQHVSPTADFPPDMWDKVLLLLLPLCLVAPGALPSQTDLPLHSPYLRSSPST